MSDIVERLRAAYGLLLNGSATEIKRLRQFEQAWKEQGVEIAKLVNQIRDLRAEVEQLRVVVSCADNLRKWWLNDGHELQEPSRSKLREAIAAYDAARRAREGE